jgi:Zn-dependent alcohol dehydrogenase
MKKIVISGLEKLDTVTSYYNILINKNNSSVTETYIQKAIDLSQKTGTYLHFNTTGKTRKFINENKSIYTYMNCWTSTNGGSQGSMYIANIVANYNKKKLTRIDLIRNEKIIKYITVKDI